MTKKVKNLEEESKNTQSCEDRIKELEEKANEYLQGWQRAKADYENLQRENEKAGQAMREMALREFVSELLPIYSCFDSAMIFVPEDQKKVDWVQGIFLIKDKIKASLATLGVHEIDCLHKEFDPNVCESMGAEDSEEYQSNIVLRVMSSGFKLGDQVIVPAKVIISK